MNWTVELKELVEKYSRGYAWICLYEDDPKQEENFKKVKTKLEELETTLKEKGVTDDQFQKIFDGIHKVIAKTYDQMTDREMDFLLKVQFGNNIKVYQRHPKTDEIIKTLAPITLKKGFVSSSLIASEMKMKTSEVFEILKNMFEHHEILQLKPNTDLWAVSVAQREKLDGVTPFVDDFWSNKETIVDTEQ